MMKKILALLLIICCCLTVVSCKKKNPDKSDDNLQLFADMFAASAPKRSEVTTTISANNLELVSTYTLITGTVGGKAASYFESNVTTMNDVENDQGDLNEKVTKTTKYYYLEGKGTRTNKGRWKADGEDFAPAAGSISLDLKKEYFENTEYFEDSSTQTLVLYIAEDLEETNGYAKKVLKKYIPQSQFFGYETKITITASGGRISHLLIECIDYEHFVGDEYDPVEISDATLVIDVSYSYNIELDMDFE